MLAYDVHTLHIRTITYIYMHVYIYICFSGLACRATPIQLLSVRLLPRRWILSFNNMVLRQQLNDLYERLETLVTASRAAQPALGAPGGGTPGAQGPKARAAAAAALRCFSQQERRKRVAHFLKSHGVLGK